MTQLNPAAAKPTTGMQSSSIPVAKTGNEIDPTSPEAKLTGVEAPAGAEAVKPVKGTFIVLKRNMYMDSNGVRMKEEHGALVPNSADAITICKHFASLGMLEEVL